MFNFHYSVAGLPDCNVLSLEQKSSVGCFIIHEETGCKYRVANCGEPMATALEAAFLSMVGEISMHLELVAKRRPKPSTC
jgi:hypothetical protein